LLKIVLDLNIIKSQAILNIIIVRKDQKIMTLTTRRIIPIFKNKIFSQKIDFLYSLNLYKYYIIIAIVVLSAVSFVTFVPTTFAESSQNISSIINSTDLQELFNKASNFYKQQKYDEALQYYDKTLEIDPNYVAALNNKAILLKDFKRYEEAIQYFDKALAIEPSNVYTLNSKAITLYYLQKYDEALQYFDKILVIDPTDVKALNNQANILQA
jgi:tetratricopeptide (TPR) repeat protein